MPTGGGPVPRQDPGEVAERLNAPVLKTGVAFGSPWVRIPPSPFWFVDAHGAMDRRTRSANLFGRAVVLRTRLNCGSSRESTRFAVSASKTGAIQGIPQEAPMSDASHGQCGSCDHFGSGVPSEQLVQIRVNPEAAPATTSRCSAPRNAEIHLSVAPTGGCDAWTPAA